MFEASHKEFQKAEIILRLITLGLALRISRGCLPRKQPSYGRLLPVQVQLRRTAVLHALFRQKQVELEQTNAILMKKLKESSSGRSSKGFKKMLTGSPTKKMKLDESRVVGSTSPNTIEKKVFKPILVNGTLWYICIFRVPIFFYNSKWGRLRTVSA